jgi:geranylgeranyl diphosphate synthase, type II
MDVPMRIEAALAAALERCDGPSSPPQLAAAIKYAVFPGGARVRPRLCLAVAAACGDDEPALADSAAAAIEMLHCASLVHDDMPCFDNADTRRGKISVHKQFSESQALLTGDALIVMAFQTLAYGAVRAPQRLIPLMNIVGRSAGVPFGIIAGQAWECEPGVQLREYHRMKTGALFSAATVAGAIAAGDSPDRWRQLGDLIGEAYQVADDIQDMISDAETLGKPCGQDAAHNRPSASRELGIEGALQRIDTLLQGAVAAIPNCKGSNELRQIILAQAKRFVPKDYDRNRAMVA